MKFKLSAILLLAAYLLSAVIIRSAETGGYISSPFSLDVTLQVGSESDHSARVGNFTAVDGTFTGDETVAGTLGATGLITATAGIEFGSASAFYVDGNGNGTLEYLKVQPTAGNALAILQDTGTGRALDIYATSARSINITASGTLDVVHISSTGDADVFNVTTNGDGNIMYLLQNNDTTAEHGVLLRYDGTGFGLKSLIANGQGEGSAGQFVNEDTDSTSTVLQVDQQGEGAALRLYSDNATSTIMQVWSGGSKTFQIDQDGELWASGTMHFAGGWTAATGSVTGLFEAGSVQVGGGYAGGTGSTFSTTGAGQFNADVHTDGDLFASGSIWSWSYATATSYYASNVLVIDSNQVFDFASGSVDTSMNIGYGDDTTGIDLLDNGNGLFDGDLYADGLLTRGGYLAGTGCTIGDAAADGAACVGAIRSGTELIAEPTTHNAVTGRATDTYTGIEATHHAGSGFALDVNVDSVLATGPAINIDNQGTGYDVDGSGSTWYITKAGVATFASATLTTGGMIVAGKIASVTDPVDLQDAATKNYVDTQIAAIPTPTLDTVTTAGNTTTNNITVGDVTTTDDAFIGDHLEATGTVIVGSNAVYLTAIGGTVYDTTNYKFFPYVSVNTGGGQKVINGYDSDTAGAFIKLHKYAATDRGDGADIGGFLFNLSDSNDDDQEFGRILVEAEDETNGDGKLTIYNETAHTPSAAMEFSGDGADINVLTNLDIDASKAAVSLIDVSQTGNGGGASITNSGTGVGLTLTHSNATGNAMSVTKSSTTGTGTSALALVATRGNGLNMLVGSTLATNYGFQMTFDGNAAYAKSLLKTIKATGDVPIVLEVNSSPTASSTDNALEYFQLNTYINNSSNANVDAASATIRLDDNTASHVDTSMLFKVAVDGIGTTMLELDGGNDRVDLGAALYTGDDVVFSGAGSGLAYADLSVAENVTATTIADPDVWTQFVGFATAGVSNMATPSAASDDITITNTGVYKVTAAISFSGQTGDTAKFEVQKNNGATEFTNCRSERKLGSTDVGSVTISCLASLTAADTVELWMLNDDDSDDFTIKHCNLNIIQIGG